MKTAAEMRATNPKFAVKTVLAEIEESIGRVNATGVTSVRFSAATTHPDRFDWTRAWTYDDDCPQLEDIILELRKHGYLVTSHYEERQFVDMDIIISWEE